MGYNGYKKYQILVQYDACTNQPTGIVKPNLPTDPDYVAPVYDPVMCPPETTTTSTTTTLALINVDVILSTNVSGLSAVRGSNTYSISETGSWNIPNYVDYIEFQIASGVGVDGVDLTLTITYNGGQQYTL